jgi:hypothetical protein
MDGRHATDRARKGQSIDDLSPSPPVGTRVPVRLSKTDGLVSAGLCQAKEDGTMHPIARLILVIIVGANIVGCASLGAERARVRSIAIQKTASKELLCTPADLSIDLDEDDGSTREWLAGCNFKAIRVRCSQGNCDQVVERTWREELYEQ